MSELDILYAAIFVFSMLVIGLSLTVLEFSRMNKSVNKKRKPSGGLETETAVAHVPKLSGL